MTDTTYKIFAYRHNSTVLTPFDSRDFGRRFDAIDAAEDIMSKNHDTLREVVVVQSSAQAKPVQICYRTSVFR